ncbi:MAG TPA: GYF domain-containing protein [Phycisphaerae bacterium]|nr:GYF domain-containing protein [Phycisphaerae bacterium]
MSNESSAATWYFRRNGRQVGPLTWEELAALCAAAKVVPADEVSSDGAQWMPGAAVTGLPFSGGNTLDYESPRERPTVMTGYACDMLSQTSPYVRIISLFMFLAAAIIGLAPLVMQRREAPFSGSGFSTGYMMASILVAILYVIPAVYLAQYATNARRFGKLRDARAQERALKAQKSFWKFMAILAVIVIALYLALMAVAYVIASMRFSAV